MDDSTPTSPWPSDSIPPKLLEFSSFVHSTSDAQVVQVVITTIRPLPDRARFLVSLPSEGAQQNLPLVLVAEAETEIVRALRWVLGRRGFTTIAAATGAEALQRAAEAQPDMILLDADLPGDGALAVCARPCADPRTRTIPVVVCSAWMGGADAALNAGATMYLEKPLGFLRQHLGDAVSAQQLLDVRGREFSIRRCLNYRWRNGLHVKPRREPEGGLKPAAVTFHDVRLVGLQPPKRSWRCNTLILPF